MNVKRKFMASSILQVSDIPYSAKYSREKTFANLPGNEFREENFRDCPGPNYDVKIYSAHAHVARDLVWTRTYSL